MRPFGVSQPYWGRRCRRGRSVEEGASDRDLSRLGSLRNARRALARRDDRILPAPVSVDRPLVVMSYRPNARQTEGAIGVLQIKRSLVLTLLAVGGCGGSQGLDGVGMAGAPTGGMPATAAGGSPSETSAGSPSNPQAGSAPTTPSGGSANQAGAGGSSQVPTTQGGFKVTVSSALAFGREDEMVELEWSAIVGSMPAATPETLVVKVVGGEELPSQALDANGDKLWDSLIFLVKLAAAESITIEVSMGSPATVAPRVLGQSRKSNVENDYYWENDRVGYRVKAHGPVNNVDIFVKSTGKLVIDKWYEYDFHEDRGEGLDPYHIGERPGAGGSGLLVNGQWAHPASYTSVKTLASGPLRAEFELTYNDYDAAGVSVKELKRVRFDAGSWLTRHESTYNLNGVASVTAVGAISLPLSGSEVVLKKGWASVWGAADVASAGSLGLALVEVPGTNATLEQVQSAKVGSSGASGEVFLSADVPSASSFSYYAGVGWSKGGFANKAAWEAYVEQFQQRLASPLAVTLQ